jgi:hypothetical protein
VRYSSLFPANGPHLAPPHPLAVELARRKRGAIALIAGIGSGRSLLPFVDGHHRIIAVDEEALYESLPLPDGCIDLLLATHVLQHGTLATLAARLAEFARVCRRGAAIALVVASTADARFGQGERIAPQCYAPTAGEERGVPHVYLTEEQTRAALAPFFTIDSFEEVDADRTVGRWAHAGQDGLRHFFVLGSRR